MNADTVQAVAGGDGEQAPAPEHAPTIHESLLEGVSPEALIAAGGGADETAPASDAPEAETPDADLAEDLTVVPEDASPAVEVASETAGAGAHVIETLAQSLPETVPAASPIPGTRAALGKVTDLATSPRISEVMGEIGEANTTVLTYLRGESAAAMAHWQALSAAKTPADAIRLQVTEMQRAADASLSCFAALARRAGRFTGALARR